MRFWRFFQGKLMIPIMIIVLIPACVTTIGTKAKFHIEEVASQRAVVSKVKVIEEEEGIKIVGEIRRKKRPLRRSIPGHIDIEIVSPDGSKFVQNNIQYHRMSRKAAKAAFSAQFIAAPIQGSIIRVIHHNKAQHE